MTENQIKKNKLDLEFNGESQKANAFLILLTTGLLAFLGSFLFLREKQSSFIFGLIITLIIFMIGLFYYKKSTKRMNEILIEIEDLK